MAVIFGSVFSRGPAPGATGRTVVRVCRQVGLFTISEATENHPERRSAPFRCCSSIPLSSTRLTEARWIGLLELGNEELPQSTQALIPPHNSFQPHRESIGGDGEHEVPRMV